MTTLTLSMVRRALAHVRSGRSGPLSSESIERFARQLEERLQRDGSELGAPLSMSKSIISFDNPSFLIKEGECHPPPQSRWSPTFEAHQDALRRAIACVGRFESPELPYDSFGTAWLVRRDVIATAAHLADYFAEQRAAGRFRLRVDFLGQAGDPAELECAVIEDLGRAPPDLALLRIEVDSPAVPTPIELTDDAAGDEPVCAIGYPAENTRFYPADKIEQMFAKIFDVKRAAPGYIRGGGDKGLVHDCSTLGGNSGSLLYELTTGKAVGMHYGAPGGMNRAIPARVIQAKLQDLGL